MAAEYTEFALTVRVPRNVEVGQLLSRLSEEEVQALAAQLQHGVSVEGTPNEGSPDVDFKF